MPEPFEFCGEPAFAARAGPEGSSSSSAEDDGYILSMLMNGQSKESILVVLDAKDITKVRASYLAHPLSCPLLPPPLCPSVLDRWGLPADACTHV